MTDTDNPALQVAAEAVAIKQAVYDLAQELAEWMAHPAHAFAASRPTASYILGQLCGWLDVMPCPECGGAGRQYLVECSKCKGEGVRRSKGELVECAPCNGTGRRLSGHYHWHARQLGQPWPAYILDNPDRYPLAPLCEACQGHGLVAIGPNPLEVEP